MNSSYQQAGTIGRFAPSPTGPLHFGTLLAALGSYLMAKKTAGRWLLRIEDLDQPRVVSGSADAMLRLLEEIGFQWDSEVIYQSQRFGRYREVLEMLRQQGYLFSCSCSRREILASAPHSEDEQGPVYPGTCRQGPQRNRPEQAVRLRVTDEIVTFNDLVFGLQQQNLEQQVGDFVLHRADGVFAYQLAVVVDDIDAGVNQIVRGADLLPSTPRQIYLYRCLAASPPEYLHLPLALGKYQKKLSKRDGSECLLCRENASAMLWRALDFLGQAPPRELFDSSSIELLAWGLENFQVHRIPAENCQVSFS